MKLKEFAAVVLLFSSSSVFAQQNADDLIKSGNKKDSEKNFPGAIQDFSAALKLDSGNVTAFYYRGYVYYEMKNYTAAIKDFNQAITLDSEDVESFFNRGNAKFEMKDYKGATADYAFALTLDPKDKQCYYNKAIAEYNLGNMDVVCHDLEQAAKLGDTMAKEVIKELCK
jgi:tetratricopeptide (TPR) repeat protein